jgi:hypothetical protein
MFNADTATPYLISIFIMIIMLRIAWKDGYCKGVKERKEK